MDFQELQNLSSTDNGAAKGIARGAWPRTNIAPSTPFLSVHPHPGHLRIILRLLQVSPSQPQPLRTMWGNCKFGEEVPSVASNPYASHLTALWEQSNVPWDHHVTTQNQPQRDLFISLILSYTASWHQWVRGFSRVLFQEAVARRVPQKPHICTASPYQHHQCWAPLCTGMEIEGAIQLSPATSTKGLLFSKVQPFYRRTTSFLLYSRLNNSLSLLSPQRLWHSIPRTHPPGLTFSPFFHNQENC